MLLSGVPVLAAAELNRALMIRRNPDVASTILGCDPI